MVHWQRNCLPPSLLSLPQLPVTLILAVVKDYPLRDTHRGLEIDFIQSLEPENELMGIEGTRN